MTRRGWPAWMRVADILDLLRLSGPVAISRAAVMAMALTDAIVLGRNEAGELPFVLNAWLPIGVSLGLGTGILIGVQILTAELAGRGEQIDTGRIFRRGLWFSIILGIVLTGLIVPTAEPMFRTLGFDPFAAEGAGSATRILAYGLIGHMITTVCSMYLEALRRPIFVTFIMYAGVAINLIIDLAFVAGWWGMPQMGADGVAMATTGTRWVITVIFLVAVWRLTPAWHPSHTGPPDEARRQLSVGLGSAVSNVAEWGGFNFTYVIATWISLATTTVYGLAVHVMGVVFMIFLGLGTATSVRVAEAFGSANRQGVIDASRLGIAATVLVGLSVGFIVILGRDAIATGMLSGEGAVLRAALAAILIPTAFAIVFDGLQNVCAMALRAQEVIWTPAVIQVAAYFVVLLPLAYGLGKTMDRGALGMMEAVIVASIVAGVLQTGLLLMQTARSDKLRAAE